MDRRVGVKADHGVQRSKLIFALLALRYHTFIVTILELFCKTGQFLIKIAILVLVRNIECGEAVLTSTNHLCFEQNNVK